MAAASELVGRRGDGLALRLGGRQRQGGKGLLCQVSCDDDDEDTDYDEGRVFYVKLLTSMKCF